MPARVPADALKTLADAYFSAAVMNTGLYNQLGTLFLALRDRSISAIALKGAHLAELVYTNIALRPMSDADILIHLEDLDAVICCLEELGYKRSPGTLDPAYYRRTHFHISMTSTGAPQIILEVHWGLT